MTEKSITVGGRVLIDARRSDKPNAAVIREAAKEVAQAQSKNMTAATIMQRIKAAR